MYSLYVQCTCTCRFMIGMYYYEHHSNKQWTCTSMTIHCTYTVYTCVQMYSTCLHNVYMYMYSLVCSWIGWVLLNKLYHDWSFLMCVCVCVVCVVWVWCVCVCGVCVRGVCCVCVCCVCVMCVCVCVCCVWTVLANKLLVSLVVWLVHIVSPTPITIPSSSPLRVVKEEIADDDTPLPNANGRVVCWVSEPASGVTCTCTVHTCTYMYTYMYTHTQYSPCAP